MEAVNFVGSTQQTDAEVKKKGQISKKSRKHIAAHYQSVASAGGGLGEPLHSAFDMTIAAIIGEMLLFGTVPGAEEDTDAATNSHK